MAEEYIVEGVPLNGLGLMSNTLGSPRNQMLTPLILLHQLELDVPDFESESASPSSLSSSRLLYPLSPVQPLIPDLQSDYCASPSYEQAALPSKQAQVDDNLP